MTALGLALLGAVSLFQAPASDSRATIRQATAAVEGDSVSVTRARWQKLAHRAPPDRAAVLGLATLARLTYDYASAESLYTSLLPHGDALPDAFAIYARMGQGLAARTSGSFTRADALFLLSSAGARRIDDTAAWAEAMDFLAATRARTVGPLAAESIFKVSARVFEHDAEIAALNHCLRAEVLVLSGRSVGNEAEEGARLAGEAGNDRLKESCLHLAAADRQRQGDPVGAAAEFARIAGERRRLRDRAGLANTLQWRGALMRGLGWLEDARRDLEEAAVEGRISGNSSAEAWALSNLALLSLALGDVSSGARYSDSSVSRFAVQGDRYGEGVVRGVQAEVAALAGEADRARGVYHSALDLLQPLGFGTGIVTAHVGLAHLAMQRQDWVDAARELELARKSAGEMPGRLRGLYYHRGVLALRMGRWSDAESEFDTGLRRVQSDTNAQGTVRQPDWEYFYGMRLAELYARRGRLQKAEGLAVTAATALDLWRSGLSQRELRLLAFQLAEDESDPDLGFATIIAALASAGRTEPAFDLVERLRARELLDLVTRADGLASGHRMESDTVIPHHEILGMATRRQIAAALPDEHTALLEYATGRGGEPTTLFVLTRSSLKAYVLSPVDSLDPLVARLNSLLESGANPSDLARTLGDRILGPALSALPEEINHLVVVPDGILHHVPFDALVTADGRFVAERFAVTLTPSATVAVHLWGLPASSGPTRVLAFGDPALEQQGERPKDSPALAGLLALPRLVESAREARMVASYGSGSTVLVGGAASEAWLKREPLESYGVVHFATHAQVDEATLAGTALALAPGNGEDGLVMAGDLGRLKLRADLVVLSACRSGGGVVVRGEGIAGLAAPLLEAGVRTVVLTRWPIGDRSTGTFVRAFYDNLASGQTVGDALRSAKLSAIARGAPPAEWAAFTIVGDPSVKVSLAKPRENGRLWWVGLIVIVAGLAWAWRGTRRRPVVLGASA